MAPVNFLMSTDIANIMRVWSMDVFTVLLAGYAVIRLNQLRISGVHISRLVYDASFSLTKLALKGSYLV